MRCKHCPFKFNNGTYEYPEAACVPWLIDDGLEIKRKSPVFCYDKDLDDYGCILQFKEIKKLDRLYGEISSAARGWHPMGYAPSEEEKRRDKECRKAYRKACDEYEAYVNCLIERCEARQRP